MKLKFWHERWEKGEIGFHQQEFNRHMQQFTDQLGVGPGGHILVPLCGKSLDMLWLAEQGYRVSGIEISEQAAGDFFVENGLESEVIPRMDGALFRGENIEILCVDFFKVRKTDLAAVDGVYDRASLIALPPDMRPGYVGHLNDLIERGTRSLLVTLDYPQAEMSGPPFSVTAAEVKQLFDPQFRIEQLYSEDCLAREPRFQKKGLTRLEEHVFLLQKTC